MSISYYILTIGLTCNIWKAIYEKLNFFSLNLGDNQKYCHLILWTPFSNMTNKRLLFLITHLI